MRSLGLILVVLASVYLALAVARWILRSRQPQPPRKPRLVVSNDGPAEDGLEARLAEAATSFGSAAAALGPEHGSLRRALEGLAAQCAALAERQGNGTGLNRPARSAVLRLLLALYGVIERLGALARHGDPEVVGPGLETATAMIEKSTDTLAGIAESADARELRKLEADLDVLRDRLERR